MVQSMPIKDDAVLAQLARDVGDDALPVLMKALAKELTQSAETIHKSLGSADYALLETTAHALKSATASFGALRLSEVCKSIEFAARDGSAADHLAALVAQLDCAIAEAREAYDL